MPVQLWVNPPSGTGDRSDVKKLATYVAKNTNICHRQGLIWGLLPACAALDFPAHYMHWCKECDF
jgi:hypothetical protein